MVPQPPKGARIERPNNCLDLANSGVMLRESTQTSFSSLRPEIGDFLHSRNTIDISRQDSHSSLGSLVPQVDKRSSWQQRLPAHMAREAAHSLRIEMQQKKASPPVAASNSLSRDRSPEAISRGVGAQVVPAEKSSQKSSQKSNQAKETGTTASEIPVPPSPSSCLNCASDLQPVEVCTNDASVFLSVYDISESSAMRVFNGLILPIGSGVFHVGISVFKTEYSYGWIKTGTGVRSEPPGTAPGHQFRGLVRLGTTPLSKERVKAIIGEMMNTWRGSDYKFVERNCTHFARALAAKLGVGPLPEWMDQLGRTAESVLAPISKVLSLLSTTCVDTCACDQVQHINVVSIWDEQHSTGMRPV